MRIRLLAGIALAVLTLPFVGAAPAQAQALTFDEARTAMDAAEAEARRNQWNLTIVIADADGIPLYLRRVPEANPRTYDIAMRKVHTALTSRMHTADYAQALAAGRTDSVPNGTVYEGGYLIRRGGQVVGAMSASGATGAQDAQVVRAGMAAIGVRP